MAVPSAVVVVAPVLADGAGGRVVDVVVVLVVVVLVDVVVLVVVVLVVVVLVDVGFVPSCPAAPGV